MKFAMGEMVRPWSKEQIHDALISEGLFDLVPLSDVGPGS